MPANWRLAVATPGAVHYSCNASPRFRSPAVTRPSHNAGCANIDVMDGGRTTMKGVSSLQAALSLAGRMIAKYTAPGLTKWLVMRVLTQRLPTPVASTQP